MSHKGFSHVALTTLDLEKTRRFYEDLLGFKVVVHDEIRIEEGGVIDHVFFDIGRDQLVAFMAPRQVADVPAAYDTGINRGLGVPESFYHVAFEAGSMTNLIDKRDELRAKGVDVTEVSDHGWSSSIYFRDPNGVTLEFCCSTRNLREEDAQGKSFTVPRSALELDPRNFSSPRAPAAVVADDPPERRSPH
jgi:catechol 2,3-dioxygenase-like lactoylglutathione lyase family enzyme